MTSGGAKVWLALAVLVAAGGAGGPGCGGGDEPVGVDLTQPVHVDLDSPPPERLSAWNLFAWDADTGFAFNETDDRMAPYELNTALFSDYAVKSRAIYVPEGASATFDPEAAFELPVGSVIVKTFAFPADLRAPDRDVALIETRLLVRHDDGWQPLPYLWNEDQTDAVYAPAGEVRAISVIDATGASRTASYLVPQKNQCESCHARKADEASPATMQPIGIKARHLNRIGADGQNQLDELTSRGLLAGAPAGATLPAAYDFRDIEADGVAAIPAGELDHAARSYLDINCAHCHDPHGVQGITSQLFLNHDNTDPFHLGVCKRPGSAGAGTGGHEFDIVPGDAEASILYFRIHTDQVGAIMPLLGRSLVHERGTELVRAWIAAMTPVDCGS